jgi:hypothetical protein
VDDPGARALVAEDRAAVVVRVAHVRDDRPASPRAPWRRSAGTRLLLPRAASGRSSSRARSRRRRRPGARGPAPPARSSRPRACRRRRVGARPTVAYTSGSAAASATAARGASNPADPDADERRRPGRAARARTSPRSRRSTEDPGDNVSQSWPKCLPKASDVHG